MLAIDSIERLVNDAEVMIGETDHLTTANSHLLSLRRSGKC